MNLLKKLVITATCAAFAIAMQPLRPAFSAETKPAETKAAAAPAKPADQKAQEPAKGSPTDVVAKVGNTPILRSELNRAEAILMKQNPPQQPLTPGQQQQVNDYLIEQLTSAELLYQAGLKVEIKDLDKQIDDKMSQGKARFPSPADFEKALKEQNLDEKLLREYTRKEIIVNNYVEKEIVPQVKVTDDEIKKFYDENLTKYFSKPAQVKASHILIGVDPKADAETRKKAKEKIDNILKEVKAGKDFAELAKANSTCPSSAKGGDLGTFGKGQMVKPFEDAAFALKTGEVSDVVETQFGYHIIKLTDKQEAQTAPLEEVKPKITEYLKGQKVQAKVQDYLKELKGKIKVEKLI
ncbi:foldase protein PrsA [Geobacter sp. OR-1]|uniref:peptidylprolyl isomerase n=1 Tax=Geobacter sp. OR-1 TaxID=1266765 RepID=UPI000543FED4|nr:peptidylprolyl isomerase [Geobacter sp. OR-1]GAM08154.1 foldase protein PrsA [Geobacter sp. OR-1]